jgi:starch synthase
LKLLFVTSEAAPFAKTGGLADVLGSLPRALAERGHQCAVMMPFYRCVRQGKTPVELTKIRLEVPVGEQTVHARVWKSNLPKSDVPVYFIDEPGYFDRDDPTLGQGLYQFKSATGEQKDYADNCARFVFLSRAVLEALAPLDFWPDVIHAHDWHTALVPVYLQELYGKKAREGEAPAEPATRGGPTASVGAGSVGASPSHQLTYADAYARIRTLFTIHNLAYQGTFWHWDWPLLGLDWKLYNWKQLESYNRINLMKGGIVFADAVNAVSARYAQEIQTKEFGCGLEDVLKHYGAKLLGIMNGVDYTEWSPATDPHIAARYDANTVTQWKPACKAALQKKFNLPQRGDVPLFGIVTRLTEQKGLDLVAGVAAEMLKQDLQLVVLGTGDAKYHNLLTALARHAPQRVGVWLEFNEAMAHQIEAGADAFLMPSKFEPSGLNQLYSLKYGTIPVVRETGGLSDSVTDVTPMSIMNGTATGIKFFDYTPAAFLTAIRRTLALYADPPLWQQVQQTGMRQDWSWNRSAAKYEEVFQRLANGTS